MVERWQVGRTGDDFDSSAAWMSQSAIKVRKMLSNPRGDESQMKVRKATEATTTKTRERRFNLGGKLVGC